MRARTGIRLSSGVVKPKADGTPHRILVTADSAFVSKQLSHFLSEEGREVTIVESAEAVGTASRGANPPVNLVLLDVTKEEALAALTKIEEHEDNARRIVLLPVDDRETAAKAMTAGAEEIVNKPVSRDDVLSGWHAYWHEPLP
ncbi:response regulator [Streptomyces sp. NPDC051582]|uniref:response regulator n=1 Tax=Streptomyces sp. NPDC051582 TaxID=3155167 RepID=UPI003416E132